MDQQPIVRVSSGYKSAYDIDQEKEKTLRDQIPFKRTTYTRGKLEFKPVPFDPSSKKPGLFSAENFFKPISSGSGSYYPSVNHKFRDEKKDKWVTGKNFFS